MRYLIFIPALFFLRPLQAGTGYAGSPAPEVTTVQGISGATPLNVTATIQPVNNSSTNQIISNNVPLIIVNSPNNDEALLRQVESNTRTMINDENESSQKMGFEIQ